MNPDIDIGDFNRVFRVDGKVAVVTGGSRGLGLSAASGLLQSGCSKVFICSRSAKDCENSANELNKLPNKQAGAVAIPIAANLTTSSQVEHLVAEVSKHTDHIDILVANAGATWGESVDTHPESAIDKILDLNVKGVFLTVQKFLPLLEKNASVESPSRVVVTGSVVGSTVGVLGSQATLIYSASKAAVGHLTNNLAADLGPRHILCNTIAPGFFPSRMSNGLIGLVGGSEVIASQSPNGRIGRPQDFAAAVVYYSSPASSHANGSLLVLDGGSQWTRSGL